MMLVLATAATLLLSPVSASNKVLPSCPADWAKRDSLPTKCVCTAAAQCPGLVGPTGGMDAAVCCVSAVAAALSCSRVC